MACEHQLLTRSAALIEIRLQPQCRRIFCSVTKKRNNMKHLSILFLILLSVALCFNSAQAQTAPNVCQAQLFFAEINMQGKIITSGNALVFVDEQPRGFLGPRPVRNSEAFSIDKSN